MTRVLVLMCQSQTGQLARVVESFVAPLRAAPGFQVDLRVLEPVEPFPFPWPFIRFFNTFPETVYERPVPLKAPGLPADGDWDLVILAYQVWFLSPPPVLSSFLQSADAARLLRDRRVATLIACRNMWLMAQEVVKERLKALGARLVDNVVLVDRAHPAATFISTPMWMLTGRRGPFLGGVVPAAGVPAEEIAATARFGRALRDQLPGRPADDDRPLLAGLGAVRVNDRLIASEMIARRSFRVWGRLLMSLGGPASMPRRVVLCFYIIFLVTMILTVVPVSAVVKRLVAAFSRERTARQHAYFSAPSGEDCSLMDPKDKLRRA